jgi:hypothetical protein
MISRLERGQAGLTFQSLEHLCETLSTPVIELFGAFSGAPAATKPRTELLMARLDELPDEFLTFVESVLDAAQKLLKKNSK